MLLVRRVLLAALIVAFPSGSLLAVPMRFLAWDQAVGARKLAVQSGSQQVALKDLHPHKRTDPVAVTTGETPPLLVATDKTSPDGKPVTVEIKMAADIQSPLVLLIPDPKHPTGIRPFVIEDNVANFKWGTMRLLNATGKVLVMRFEKTVVPLPASWTPVDVALGGEGRNVGVEAIAKDDPKSMLYSAVWEHDMSLRKLVIIVPDTDGPPGAVDFKVIPENRRAVEAAAASKP
ncbi:hypothetical protein [Luteolibacter sp. Populi]|uniref:hypothetical protein n=1 Tax=Luteolibacter sp. Populi TaxID=3230487 RepID=UPI0034659EE3